MPSQNHTAINQWQVLLVGSHYLGESNSSFARGPDYEVGYKLSGTFVGTFKLQAKRWDEADTEYVDIEDCTFIAPAAGNLLFRMQGWVVRGGFTAFTSGTGKLVLI